MIVGCVGRGVCWVLVVFVSRGVCWYELAYHACQVHTWHMYPTHIHPLHHPHPRTSLPPPPPPLLLRNLAVNNDSFFIVSFSLAPPRRFLALYSALLFCQSLNNSASCIRICLEGTTTALRACAWRRGGGVVYVCVCVHGQVYHTQILYICIHKYLNKQNIHMYMFVHNYRVHTQ